MANWYSTDWWHRVPVIVRASQAGGATHADYPCLLASSLPAHLWGRVRSDGLDCVLTAADGVTPLYREVATFDVAGERPEVYFRLPSYSHLEDTLVYLYYRNPDYSEPSDVAVWPTDTWAAVYHMNDNPTDSTQILDSTANANHGTKGAGAAAPTEVAGTVGMAQSFVRADLETIRASAAPTFDSAVTLMALVTQTTLDGWSQMLGFATGAWDTSERPWRLGITPTGQPQCCVRLTGATEYPSRAGTNLATGTPYLITGTYDSTSGVLAFYTNATLKASGVYDGLIKLDAAQASWLGQNFDGLIDELRLSSSALSGEEIAATDHWLRNNALCYEVGAYENRPLYVMQGYRRVTTEARAEPQTYRRVSERTEYVAQGYRRLTLPAEYIAQGYRRVVNKALYTIATKRRLRPLYRILGRPSYGMDHHPKPDYGLGPNGRPDDRNL